ncbi:hypothetical protein [Flavobacterium sp. W20_MBD1_R3]|uniref:hypothetical protein n=1 Tax=Flavobacterium sp. W20_MBD1_R3 TaxID=3240278 RepID=UPI003F91A937
MFSQGQFIFAGFFFVAFVIAMIYAYRKDLALHKRFYKGNYKILIGFGVFIGILFLIKVFFKR